MNEPIPLDPPVKPADMEEVKSICSLIRTGRISWDDIVKLYGLGTVKHSPPDTRTPEERKLARELHDALAANHGNELHFESVTNALFTHLFDRSLDLLPNSFEESVNKAKETA